MQHSHPQMNLYRWVIFFSWGGRIFCNVESLMMILLSSHLAYFITPSSKGHTVQDEQLTVSKGVERGTYRWVLNRRFHIVATILIYHKKLHLLTSLRNNRIKEVSRRRGLDKK